MGSREDEIEKRTDEIPISEDNIDIKRHNKNKNIIAWLALVVALFGGVPGAVDLINNIWSSKVDIVFEDMPFAGTILCPHFTRNGKSGVFFYKVSFVGKGEKPTTIKSVDLYLRFGNNWKKGRYFAPVTNSYEGQKNALFTATAKDQLIVHEWHNFIPYTEDQLTYGKKHTFSLGFYFKESSLPFEECNEWKIVVYDFFNNKYQFTKNTPIMTTFHKGGKIFVLDCPVDSLDVFIKLIQTKKFKTSDLKAVEKRLAKTIRP